MEHKTSEDVAVLPIQSEEGSYDLVIGQGLLQQSGTWLRRVIEPDARVLVVYDERLDEYGYPASVAASLRETFDEVALAKVPTGEESKSWTQAIRLYSACIEAGLDRRSIVVALGGGVIGDLAGFVASTYMRGVRFAQIPTTLLAHDASIGGKVGINLAEGKNLVGSFHAPRLVLYDVAALRTLPSAGISSGLAEAIKHGLIRDPDLFAFVRDRAAQLLARDPAALRELLYKSCAVKAEIVQADERESGLRAILNFGHTVGHAVEGLAYGRFSHGASVAIGMVVESVLAVRLGLASPALVDTLRHALKQAELPIDLPEDLRTPSMRDRLLELMRHDKKAVNRSLSFVLPKDVGQVEIVKSVREEEVVAALLG